MSALNSEHLVYVTGFTSPDNTTGEPAGESDIDSSGAVALISISKRSQGYTVFNPQTTTITIAYPLSVANFIYI